jgi:hypothetical protein
LTQVEMLRRANPTFVTVWIGNNDVLGAALDPDDGGDVTQITPQADFTARYGLMMTDIDGAGALGGVLIGIPNVAAIPYFSLGSTYWTLDQAGAFDPAPFTVGPNCAPAPTGNGDEILVPFPFGGALLSAAQGGTPTALTCDEPETIQPAELAELVAAVTGYNQTIAAAATAREWAYFDPNPAFDSLRAITTEVAPFPAFGDDCDQNPFGLAFSCDGIHPSANAQKLIANKLIQTINVEYGTDLEEIP